LKTSDCQAVLSDERPVDNFRDAVFNNLTRTESLQGSRLRQAKQALRNHILHG